MYIHPKHLLAVKRFDKNRFRPVATGPDAPKRVNDARPSDLAKLLP